MKKEDSIQLAVSTYLKIQYPYTIFTAESSGLKLTIGQAVKAKKQRNPVRGLPDLFIIESKFVVMKIKLKESHLWIGLFYLAILLIINNL